MKNLNKVAFLLMFFLTLICQGENLLLLGHEQFLNLTSSEQKLYISEVRKLLFSLEESGQLSSATKSKWSYFFDLVKIASAHAETNPYAGLESSRVISTDIRIENAKISHMQSLLLNLIKASQGPIKSETLRSSARETYIETFNRIQILAKRDLTSEQKANLGANLKDMKDNYDLLVQTEPSIKSILPKLQTLSQQFPKISKSTASVETRRPRATKLVGTTPATTGTTGSRKTPVTSSSTVAPETTSSLRCIYAGFVIKKTTCEPNKILPDDYMLKEISDKEKFKCTVESDVLCNPLVFGFQSSESPYCTSRSNSASKNCEELANNTENLTRIQKIWSNPNNRKTYENFHADLKNICSTEQKNKDILATCPIVISQFNKVMKAELPVSTQASTSPSPITRTDKSASKN